MCYRFNLILKKNDFKLTHPPYKIEDALEFDTGRAVSVSVYDNAVGNGTFIRFGENDELAGYLFSLNGSRARETTPPKDLRPWDTTQYPNGEYKITVKAYDAKGNFSQQSRVFKIRN